MRWRGDTREGVASARAERGKAREGQGGQRGGRRGEGVRPPEKARNFQTN